MGRDSFLSPVELPLMEEPQTRGKKRDDRRGFVYFRSERCRCPRLIVVFEKAGQLSLIIESARWDPFYFLLEFSRLSLPSFRTKYRYPPTLKELVNTAIRFHAI